MPKPVENKKWFEMTAQNSGEEADIHIYGLIVGYRWDEQDTSAKSFLDALKGLGPDIKTLRVYLNSDGGNVWAGLAIHNQLKRHKARVEMHVDGIAASIASIIAMAGDVVYMPENALMMVHKPSGGAWGTADEMRKMAEALDKAQGSLVSAYRDKTGLDEERIHELLNKETWLTAAEAVELGFADEMTPSVQMAACAGFDFTRFRNVPAQLQAAASTTPARSTGRQPIDKGEKPMELKDLQAKHPDLVTQIQSDARAGMIAQADADTAKDQAVKAATDQTLGVISAVLGEELGPKVTEIVNSGVTVAQVQALGVSLAPAAAAEGSPSRAQILAGLQGAAPAPVGSVETETGDDQTFEQVVAAHQAKHSCSKGQAISAVAKAQPELHAKYLAGLAKK